MMYRSRLYRSFAVTALVGVLAACGTPASGPSAAAPTSAVVPTTAPAPTSVPAPTSAPTDAPAPTSAPAPTAAPTHAAATTLPAQFDVKLRGTIGQAAAQIYLRRTSEFFSGDYFYEQVRADSGLEQSLWLSGTLGLDGTLMATEEGDNGSTGVFKGTLKQAADSGYTLDGTWSTPSGDRTEPMHFVEVRPTATAYTLTTKTTEEQDAAHKATYTAAYPQISGAGAADAAFNALAAQLATKPITAFKADISTITDTQQLGLPDAQSYVEVSYELMAANDSVISVLFHEYWYMAGAAHPNNVTFVLNYDLANNRQLALADLFKPGTDYLKFLSNYSLERLRKRDSSLFEEGATPKEENFKSWNVDQQGLQITFDPYQVMAYASGPQVVFVPFAQLNDVLNPQAPIISLITK